MRLELRGITKRFGPLVANDHIDLVVQPGSERTVRGHTGGPRRVTVPDGWFARVDDPTPPGRDAEAALSGG